ncbi:hypothetical protein [Novosphingobium taihuense]|uniref:Uncharacterized protein n=1 Tax=Novosphingobium taihuense TaxID=260085 RepID=A0A7W7ACL5_9SPHN|nr:hypothetical protein [Novosphingobium taihuense]MBB4614456.1 hypothetical protein [Novosphingobium taihuense]
MPAQAQQAPALSAQTHEDLRCSAAFALVSLEQSSGEMLAGWPQLAVRGKRFFADSGEAAMKEGQLSREQVRELIAVEVRALQTASDPDKALADLAKPCVARLDAKVAPLAMPNLSQCAAIFGIAYDEVHGREGMSPAAQDLRTLASVLAAREREALIAAGGTGDDADRKLSEARTAMGGTAADGTAEVDRYEIAHCYDLAKPAEKSHY